MFWCKWCTAFLAHGGIFSVVMYVRVCVRLFVFIYVCKYVFKVSFVHVCMFMRVKECVFSA